MMFPSRIQWAAIRYQEICSMNRDPRVTLSSWNEMKWKSNAWFRHSPPSKLANCSLGIPPLSPAAGSRCFLGDIRSPFTGPFRRFHEKQFQEDELFIVFWVASVNPRNPSYGIFSAVQRRARFVLFFHFTAAIILLLCQKQAVHSRRARNLTLITRFIRHSLRARGSYSQHKQSSQIFDCFEAYSNINFGLRRETQSAHN